MKVYGRDEISDGKVWDENLPKTSESEEAFIFRLNQSLEKPAPGKVPEQTFWAVIRDEVIGRISFRHGLNENLKSFGGHIGYEVRPSQRQKGYAKLMLKKVLETSKAKEIGELLLTCSTDYVASNKTIEANGGILLETKYVAKWDRRTNYYWIKLGERK